MTPFPYRLATRAAAALAPLVARWSPKLGAGLAGRQASARDFAAWGAAGREDHRPLLVVHGASAGELRQAQPVLQRLRGRHPAWQLAVTCFSPSGLPVAAELGADVSGLLPWDTPAAVATLLDQLRPTAIVLIRAELWPELIAAAGARGIGVGLIAATLPPGSGRLRWPVRRILAPAAAALAVVGAVTEEDAARLGALGIRAEAMTVTGDPRADAVLERLATGASPPAEPQTLVAGSTWPDDEAVLLTAFRAVRGLHPSARLLIAPHEPTPRRLAALRARVRATGFPDPGRYDGTPGAAPIRVVETVGGLAWLYALGQIAYVGGGFGRAGVHSVLEPAAAGCPVLAGPAARRNADARRLRAAGALEWLPRRGAAAVLEAWWGTWLTDDDGRGAAAAAAREAVLVAGGAADRSAVLVERLVGPTTRTTS